MTSDDPLDHEDLTEAQKSFLKKAKSSFTRGRQVDNFLEFEEIVVESDGTIAAYLDVIHTNLEGLKLKMSFVDVKSVIWHEDGPTIKLNRYGKTYKFHIGYCGV